MQQKQLLKSPDREPAYQRYYNFASQKYAELNDPKAVLESLRTYTIEHPVEFAIGGDPMIWILLRKEDGPVLGRLDELRDKNTSTEKTVQQLAREGHSPVKVMLMMYASNHLQETKNDESLAAVVTARKKAFGYLFGGIALVVAGGIAAFFAYEVGYIVFAFLGAVVFGLSFVVYALYAIPASTKAIMQAKKKW
jgi:hypothetical protein